MPDILPKPNIVEFLFLDTTYSTFRRFGQGKLRKQSIYREVNLIATYRGKKKASRAISLLRRPEENPSPAGDRQFLRSWCPIVFGFGYFSTIAKKLYMFLSQTQKEKKERERKKRKEQKTKEKKEV